MASGERARTHAFHSVATIEWLGERDIRESRGMAANIVCAIVTNKMSCVQTSYKTRSG